MNMRGFSLFSMILLGVNMTVGAGIFGLPGIAYKTIGPSSILVIIFCMVLMGSIALCFAEVGSWFDVNGGVYVYAKEAFGDFIGFEVGFMKWFIGIIAWAALSNFFALTLSNLFPALKDPLIQKVIVIMVLFSLSVVNILGVKVSEIVNNLVTFGKLIPIFLFIFIGLFFIDISHFTPFIVISEGERLGASFVTAVLILFYAYTGFESLGIAAGEFQNAKKNVPRAIISVLLIVSILYIFIITISVGILGEDLSGSTVPVADAAKKIMGSLGYYFILIGMLVSIGGINVAASFLNPRSGASLAEQGILPAFIASKNRYGAPYVAILITSILSGLLAISGSFTFLIQISVISRFIQYIPISIAVLVFRKKYKDREVNFRIPFGPIVPLFSTIVSFWLLYNAGVESPKKILIGCGGLLLGVPLYFILKLKQKKRSEV